jgi:hypothetical protein
MKFNPHLHILTDSNVYFNYKFSRLWRGVILSNLGLSSNRYYYGYYVWSNKKPLDSNHIARYVARYVRHPIIANSRIICYAKKHIFFFYEANNEKIILKKSINSFISCLIQHIPPSQFKMIRYYGVYARKFRSRRPSSVLG